MLKTLRQEKHWRYRYIILTTILALVLSGCEKDKDNVNTDTSKKVAVVVYMAGESNLSDDASLDFEEMKTGCSHMTDNDRLFVYMDNADKSSLPCIYEISRKSIGKQEREEIKPAFTFESDHNSASASTLDSVLNYVYSRYEADSYRLVFWSHGSGWIPSITEAYADLRPTLKAFGVDTGTNNKYSSMGSQMEIADMAETLEKHRSIDLVMFDACFMQTIEVAYELRNSSRYIVGSPAEIPGWGAPYEDILLPMFADSLDTNAIIAAYQNNYKENNPWYGILLSTIDCHEIEGFAQTHRAMMHKYRENLDGIDLEGVQNYFIYDEWKNQSDLPDHYDIKGLMQRIITDEADYKDWEAHLNRLVPHSCYDDTWYTMYYSYGKPNFNHNQKVDSKQYSGLTMYLEQEKYKDHYYYDAYHQTEWAKAMK